MSTHKAKCDRCQYRAGFSDTLRSYRFEDGSDLTIQRTFVWCARCEGIQWGEVLPALADLEKQLAAPMSASAWGDLERQVAWRRARTSPPRCLECAAIRILPLEKSETKSGNAKWILREHPECGGTITVLREPVLALNRGWILYSPEGD